jgi:hypothetical protein
MRMEQFGQLCQRIVAALSEVPDLTPQERKKLENRVELISKRELRSDIPFVIQESTFGRVQSALNQLKRSGLYSFQYYPLLFN